MCIGATKGVARAIEGEGPADLVVALPDVVRPCARHAIKLDFDVG